MKLTIENLVVGTDGKRWIMATRNKNGNPFKIPLLSKSDELISKYKDPTFGHFPPTHSTSVIVWCGQRHQEKRLVKKSLSYHRFEKSLKSNVFWEFQFFFPWSN